MAVWRRHIWKSLWIALRRSGKDRRARAALGAWCVAVVSVAAYGAWGVHLYQQATAEGMIADLAEAPLRQLAAVALAREEYAAYLVDQVSRETATPFALWSAEARP